MAAQHVISYASEDDEVHAGTRFLKRKKCGVVFLGVWGGGCGGGGVRGERYFTK